MENNKLIRSEAENSVFASLKIHTYIALSGMALPSLRCIAINWNSSPTDARLLFFHDGPVGNDEIYHYGCIQGEATSMRHPSYKGEQIDMPEEVISYPYPTPLPPVSEVVYLRKEPGSKFAEVNTFVPDWALCSIIRLKVNEALRGKITPALRRIQSVLDETNMELLITFFHDGTVTEAVQEEYEDIFEIATTTITSWKEQEKVVSAKFTVVGVPYPKKIPSEPDGEFKEIEYLYSRKEPFTDETY